MYAIIETGGKQLIVQKGDVIYVEKLQGEEGSTIVFDKVLLFDKKIGQPYVKGATVTGKIEKHGKQKKIIVYRHNAKSTHKRKLGHRQPYTKIEIIELKG
ncbi:large subunit ribosomal protein L21 [Mycoplasma testudineum]|uniref:Large ribosomal subunit protein bL21 n=1 Tax=Mycoplasma testudineum TaxID=244584 RepID=A0A4R6IE63_9MOLU|nr:50S ribosomal protein L21 [Mycoplasma testudineum]OYD27015.1 50S ribosomal protein L21 [Mycoplasma testudineum]TDO20563.1 large subunit ribosomal protein L21 [Mycoplasma testudineum]